MEGSSTWSRGVMVPVGQSIFKNQLWFVMKKTFPWNKKNIFHYTLFKSKKDIRRII